MIAGSCSSSKMMSMLQNPDFNEDLSKLMREQKRQQEAQAAADLEKELSICRSGSAPPTVEGSLNSIGGLFNDSALLGTKNTGNNQGVLASEEELRADPAYVNYYYSNGNLNPRLPPPFLSKEDWRSAQRLQGGNPVAVGGIGDRRKENGSGNRSLFAVQPGFGGGKDDGGGEWGGEGLIGLQGLGGLGNRQRSIAEMIQDDMKQTTALSRHPSRPASRNAFDDDVETSESQFAHLHRDLASIDALRSVSNKQGMAAVQNVGSSASHTYASALGASLSRNATPDPQLVARAPSPRIPSVGGGRVSSVDKRRVTGSSSFNGVTSSLSESEELAATFSGLNLTKDGIVDEDNHPRAPTQHEIDDLHNLFNLQGQNSGLAAGQVELNKPSLSSANSYFKGSSRSAFNDAGGSPSHLQNVDNMNSAFSNYGLGGFAINPSSPPMIGSQLGNGNLPALFESVAAVSAMGGTSVESRALGGSLGLGPSGPNLMAAAAELQNFSRLGNQSAGNALQVPLVDPLYLQYLRSNELAAAQVALLNENAVDRDYLGNPYMDLLQKAYVGSLLSPQKSQYGLPYLGRSGSMNHNYYGNPPFGLGMSYPGNSLANPLLSNSLMGSGSPVSHGERNMRFSSGMRNLSGGIMGPWHSETGGNLDESFPSSLLDEFKSNKTRCFELSEIAGHVVEFSADQYGSRFIQQKLETATAEEKNMVFREIMPEALSLMTDVFGNYVIQKFFEHGTASQIRELADQLTGHVLTLSLQMYGCRVIQKAIEVVELDQQTKMVKELDGHVMRCVRDQNGNHVVQKCIECIPEEAIQFVVSTFYDQVVTLSTHPYGCRVIQRVLEHCHDAKTQTIMMDEILHSVCMLAQDQYGNYVVQHVLEHGKPLERSAIIKKLTGQIVQMSQQKFASNVVEKCLTFGTPLERQTLVNEMLGSTDENEPLQLAEGTIIGLKNVGWSRFW